MLANNFRLQFQDTNYFQMQDYAEMNGKGPISECKRHQRLISKIRLLNNFILHSLILNQITLHYSTLMQRRTVTAHCKPRASDVLTETLNIKRDKKWKKWNNFEKQTTKKKNPKTSSHSFGMLRQLKTSPFVCTPERHLKRWRSGVGCKITGLWAKPATCLWP